MTRPTDALIHSLATELAPVRRVPRLRTVVSLALVFGGATSLVWMLLSDAHLAQHPDAMTPYYTAIIAVGIAAALGGICAAGASPVPGRERVQTYGTRILVGGLCAAAVVAGFSIASGIATPGLSASWLENGAACSALVALLALPPAVVLLRFALRGTPERRAFALGLAGASAATLASVAANLTCTTCDLTHAVVFHQLAPALLAGTTAVLLFALPLPRVRTRA